MIDLRYPRLSSAKILTSLEMALIIAVWFPERLILAPAEMFSVIIRSMRAPCTLIAEHNWELDSQV